MSAVLRLYEDILSNDATVSLPARPRMIFVVHGAIMMGDRVWRDGEAWNGEDAVTFKAGREGAAVWRWELARRRQRRRCHGRRRRLARKTDGRSGNIAARPAAPARRQRRVSRLAAAPICTAIRAPASAA